MYALVSLVGKRARTQLHCSLSIARASRDIRGLLHVLWAHVLVCFVQLLGAGQPLGDTSSGDPFRGLENAEFAAQLEPFFASALQGACKPALKF